MKKKVTSKNIYRSFTDFEKEFLPDTYRARTDRKDEDAHSLGVQMANEVIDSIRRTTKPTNKV